MDINGDFYEGSWVNGCIHGFCKIKYSSGDIYEGEFQNGKQTGIGVMYFTNSNERYEGQWINGKMTGNGKYFFSGKEMKKYTGQFFNGDIYGYGIMETVDYIYRGMVKNGLFDGFGRFEHLKDLEIYEGNFSEGKR